MKQITIILLMIITVSSYSQKISKIESFFNNREFNKVIIEGNKILENTPNDIKINHIVGRALTEQKKFKKAIPFLQKSIKKTSPNWLKSWSYGCLGVCYYATDDYKNSKSNFIKAIKLNATKNSTKYAKKRLKLFQMSKYFDEWIIIETSNLRFHFQPNHEIKNLTNYCTERENAYKEINTFFNAKPYKKIDFYIWSNPIDGKKKMGKEIGFANSDLCIINARINQTIGHEITHILNDFGIKPNQKNRLINEGVAVAFDLTNRNRIELAKHANKSNLGIKELMKNADKLSGSLIYPIGGALIKFLRQQGTNKNLKVLLKNQTWDNLIKLYGKKTIHKFEEEIRNEK